MDVSQEFSCPRPKILNCIDLAIQSARIYSAPQKFLADINNIKKLLLILGIRNQ